MRFDTLSFNRAVAVCMAAVSTLAGGCATSEPASDMLRNAEAVTPVLTEHSAGLKCLGALIDQSRARPVDIVINDIDDTTVPLLNEERRLSMGGQYVLRTALSRMESPRVNGVVNASRAGPRVLEFTGAWTQDDQFTRDTGLSVRARLGKYFGALGGRNAYDFIAGDFASSVDGRVLLSTAVGVVLSRKGRSALLVIDDGGDRSEIGLDRSNVDGAQMAQRRILEAVALVHVADYFNIDYRPCLQASFATPDAFVSALGRYSSEPARARAGLVQQELSRLGYLAPAPDGQWGPVSRSALMSFQARMNLPPTGAPSGVMYAFLATTENEAKPGQPAP